MRANLPVDSKTRGALDASATVSIHPQTTAGERGGRHVKGRFGNAGELPARGQLVGTKSTWLSKGGVVTLSIQAMTA